MEFDIFTFYFFSGTIDRSDSPIEGTLMPRPSINVIAKSLFFSKNNNMPGHFLRSSVVSGLVLRFCFMERSIHISFKPD